MTTPFHLVGSLSDNPIGGEVARLYGEHAPRLVRYAMTATRCRELAQDVVQETFFRYFLHRSEGGPIHNPRSWLFRVLRNHIIDKLKERSLEVRLESETPNISGAFGQHESNAWSDLAPEIEKLLTPRELDCVRLRAQGLDYHQIAAALSIRSGTVGALLTRALTKLRRGLKRGFERV